MRNILLTVFSFLSLSIFSQSQIDQVFKTLTPENTMTFYVIDEKINGFDLTNGICVKYDKVWNELESHDAQQSNLTYKNYVTASMGSEYDSEKKQYIKTGWEEDKITYYTSKKYSFSWTNFNEYYQGAEKKLYYTRLSYRPFIYTRSVYFFPEYKTDIAGQLSSTSSSYRLLITDYEFINWDGELVQKIILPYYLDGAYAQYVNVEDKSYIVIGASNIYSKDIVEDIDSHSDKEYDLRSLAIEPEYYHHFIYEYNRETNSIDYIKSYKTPNDGRNLIGIFDANGLKLDTPKKGVNIYLYSDGTSQKVLK